MSVMVLVMSCRSLLALGEGFLTDWTIFFAVVVLAETRSSFMGFVHKWR